MKKIVIFTTIALLIFSAFSWAQPRGHRGLRGPDFEPGDPDACGPPGPMRDRFRTIQMWKLTEALDLTEEQAGKFFPLFRNFQNSIDSVRQSNDELFKKLDGYITAGEKTKIEEIITQIEKNEAKILDSRTKFRKDAAKVLDEIQIGKLVMFHHEFPRRFRDAIWDYRMHEPLPPGPPVPPEPRGK